MRVRVRLFARLRDVAGAGEIVREVPGGATVGALWTQMLAEWPDLAPYEQSVSCAVNTDYARFSATLAEGDEVAFLPPVSGG